MNKLFALNNMLLFFISTLFLPVTIANEAATRTCDAQRVNLQVLGSGGPELDDGRNSSGYIVWVDGKSKLIVDAGPGTSVAFGAAGGKFEQVSALLLTHLHVDHSSDLPAYIKGSFFTPRQNVLIVAGPTQNALMPSTSDYVQRLMGPKGAFAYLKDYVDKTTDADYKINVVDIDKSDSNKTGNENQLNIDAEITASAVTVHHGPVAAVAWKIQVLGCTLVFSGDMSNDKKVLATFAKNADLLIANNAVPETAGEVAKNLHMTPSEIGEIANSAQVRKLLLSHFMQRTLPTQQLSLKHIRASYSGPVDFAEDGMTIWLNL